MSDDSSTRVDIEYDQNLIRLALSRVKGFGMPPARTDKGKASRDRIADAYADFVRVIQKEWRDCEC